jgi:hypothetical protein
LFKQLLDSNPLISFSHQINSLVRFIKPIEAHRDLEASLIVVMVKMSSTHSERSSKPGAQGNHGARIRPAALAEPPTPTVETARSTADTNRPFDGASIGKTMEVMVTMEFLKLYTPVISKIIFSC